MEDFNLMSVFRKLTHEEIVSRQVALSQQPKIPFVVVLNDIRSLHNVGTVFRTADGVGLSKVWLTGITGYPPQSGISKIALGAEDVVNWEYRQDVVGLLKELKLQGYEIVLLEQAEGSIRHSQYIPKGPVCLVVGNEVEGVSDALMDICDCVVEIEMHGVKNSLNAAVAFGVIAYHIRHAMVNSHS